MKHYPLISIVMPSLNQVGFIGEALKSVQLQNYKHCEHLVIDGMSTDGTVEVLRSLTADGERQNISWVSESDSGQSDALNRGFRQAKGDIIGWLNSDDRYRAGCFDHVVRAFEENPEVDIFYGDYLIIDELGEALQLRREIEFSEFILLYHRILYIPTTATFFRRKIFDEGNWLDSSLHYVMDLEFFIRLATRGYRFKHIPEVLADFRMQPSSKTCTSPDKQRMEHQRVVLASAPILRRLQSSQLKSLALSVLRSMACVRRYSEKMVRGYYRKSFQVDRLKP